MTHQKAKNWSEGLFCGAIAAAAAGTLLAEIPVVPWVLGALSILGVAAGLWILFRYYKCPHCGKRLPSRAGRLDFCPRCGARLEDW